MTTTAHGAGGSHDCPAVDDLAALRAAVTGLAREVEGLRRSLGGFASGLVIYWIANNVLTHLVWLLKLIIRSKNVHLPQESGKNQARLASQQGEKGVSTSGRYFEGDHEIASSVDSHDQAKQEDLWRWTVDFLAKDEKEKKEFETF